MPRARAERTKSKASLIEDLSLGIERLQAFIPQIEDLGREGFPYLEGARARTELQLKECIRKVFGEKSPEHQQYKQHKLSMESPADTKKSVALIKSLIATLEDKKLDLQGLKPPPPEPAQAPPSTPRPQMTLVPPVQPATSAVTTPQVTITTAAPVQPPPITMSVALSTNLDLSKSGSAVARPSPPPPAVVQQTPVSTAPAPTATHESVAAPMAPAAPVVPVLSATPPAARPAAVSPLAQPQLATTSGPVAAPPVAPIEPRLVKAVDAALLPPAAEPRPSTKADRLGETPIATEQQAKPDIPVAIARLPKPSTDDPLELVKSVCRRFHLVARQLRLRGEYRATLDVEDEFDVQDLLHALLRLHFDDIETDEWVPSYANGSPRIMFLLNDGRVGLVVKKTRTGLNAKDLAEQLHVDVEHCRTLKRCSTLLCFVYDPEGRIGNPRGLEADLICISDQLTADVVVAPK